MDNKYPLHSPLRLEFKAHPIFPSQLFIIAIIDVMIILIALKGTNVILIEDGVLRNKGRRDRSCARGNVRASSRPHRFSLRGRGGLRKVHASTH
jgi:hypothetical protein